MTTRDISLRFPMWQSVAGTPPMRSLWVDQALARENSKLVEFVDRTIRRDVCIVGGGFTGLWTAIRMLEHDPAVSICIVEADLCGTGASGRNSGAATSWWPRAAALVAQFGDEGAREVLSAGEAGVKEIWSFVKEHEVDCELRHVRSVWTANVPSQSAPWESVFRTADRLGLKPPFRRLSADELQEMNNGGLFHDGVLDVTSTRVQPALLARGLRRRAIELGCEIFERSPVSRIEGTPGCVKVCAGLGTIEAQKVVLAANAWMAHFDEFRPRIHTTSSDMVVTEPIGDRLEELNIATRPGGINIRQMTNYWGYTPDGRVYFGRGGGALTFRGRITPDYHWSATRAQATERDFHLLYPALAKVPAKHAWGGPVDRSTNGLPMFGCLLGDDRISYAIGYTGHGVAATALGGRILSAIVLEKRDEWRHLSDRLAAAQTRQFPPEPARYFVGTLVRDAVARKETRELRGGTTGIIDKTLAKLATTTLPAPPLASSGRASGV
jgi:glycine/D-amino acid oxidase-like deaminating enzyme